MIINVNFKGTYLEFEVTKDSTTIGRGSNCDIRIISDSISRKHAIITKEGNSYYIADNGSTNGVLINGERVSKSELNTFLPVFLGEKVELTFDLNDEEAMNSNSLSIKNNEGDNFNLSNNTNSFSTPQTHTSDLSSPTPRNREKRSSRCTNSKSSKKNINKSLPTIIIGIALTSFLAYKLYPNQEEKKSVAKVAQVKKIKKVIPTKIEFDFLLDNVSCSLSGLTCNEFNLNSKQKVGFFIQKGTLYILKDLNISNPKEMDLKAETIKPILNSKIIYMLNQNKIDQIEIIIHNFKFEVYKPLYKLITIKQKPIRLTGGHLKVLKNSLSETQKIDLVLNSLKKYLDIKFINDL